MLCLHVVQDRDLFEFEQSGRRSTTSDVGGHGQIQEELRYTTEPDEATIESPALRDLQYAPLMSQDHQQQQLQQQGQVVDATPPSWDDQRRPTDNINREYQQTDYEPREKPGHLDVNKPTAVCTVSCQHTAYVSLHAVQL